jgi:hypothetical protein
VSVPTWLYRGFTNLGVDDGFLFTALGGDSTGGILWGPSTLAAADAQGVWLTEGYRIIDTARGEKLEPGEQRVQPMTVAEIAALRVWLPQEMAQRIVRFKDLRWSSRALLDSALPGAGAQLAPVVGLGMVQDRDALAPVHNAHGLSIEWLRLPPGAAVSRHRLKEKQVLIAKAGTIDIGVQTTAGPVSYHCVGTHTAWDTFSLPPGCWRTLTNRGSGDALALLLTAGDHRKAIEWDAAVVQAAAAQGLVLDASGYVAERRFVERSQR